MTLDLKTRGLTRENVLKIAQGIVEHLTFFPGDFAGAAQKVGLRREVVISLINDYPEMFHDIEDQFFDKLHSLCRLNALGKELPSEYAGFDFNKARTLLTWRQKEVKELNKERRLLEKKEKGVVSVIDSKEAQIALKDHLAKLNLLTTDGELNNVQTEESYIVGESTDREPSGDSTDETPI